MNKNKPKKMQNKTKKLQTETNKHKTSNKQTKPQQSGKKKKPPDLQSAKESPMASELCLALFQLVFCLTDMIETTKIN